MKLIYSKCSLSITNCDDGYLTQKIDLEKTYTVGLNDFLANGGGFFSKVKKWYEEKNRKDSGTVRLLMGQY